MSSGLQHLKTPQLLQALLVVADILAKQRQVQQPQVQQAELPAVKRLLQHAAPLLVARAEDLFIQWKAEIDHWGQDAGQSDKVQLHREWQEWSRVQQLFQLLARDEQELERAVDRLGLLLTGDGGEARVS